MRDIKVALFIAYKSILKGSKSTLALIIFILSLTVLNMMFISGILFGMQNLIKQVVIDNLSSTITISPQEVPQPKEYILNQDEVRAQIENIPGVQASTRRYSLAGSMSYDKEKNGIFKSISAPIVGIDPGVEKTMLPVASRLIAGKPLDDSDRDQLVLSSALAGGYGIPAPADLGGVEIGDKLQVVYSNGVMRTYTVKGLYNDSIGTFQAFITFKEAESVLSTFNTASQILVKADLKTRPLEIYSKQVKKLFPNLKVQTYLDLAGSFASFLNALNLIAIIVSAISILVAAITIFVLIYINAINKRRQIGILKAIGIKERIIILSYVFQSLFYAFSGVIIGSIFVFGVLTPLLASYPIDVTFGLLSLFHNTTEILGGTISLIAAGLLAGLIPSRIVVRQEILKAIWG